MKSVCFVVQSVYDFDPRVKRKAEALVDAGYIVDVLALCPSSGKKNYSVNGVNVRTVSLGKNRGSLARYFFEYSAFFLWGLFQVTRQMMRRRYAVIDFNSLPDFLVFAGILTRWMGAKLILDLHEITPEFYMSKYRIPENSWMIRLLKFQEKISVDFADQVITVNEPIEDLLVGRGLSRAKSTVIMNVADEARFLAAPTLAAAPELNRDRFVMMYHGTLTNIYGLDLAIEALALVHQEIPNAELWILGSGTEKNALAALAEKLGIASKVRLVGQVPAAEIPSWLVQCDAGILPIRRDIFLDFAFPNKLPEFIIMGKPVLVSRLNAIRHYFDENTVAYFDPNSPADLSRQMVHMYRDVEFRTRLAYNAREAYGPIRWSVMRGRYLGLMERFIEAELATVEPARASAMDYRRNEKPLKSTLELKSVSHLNTVAETDSVFGACELRRAIDRFTAWVERVGYATHDPYDIWGTAYGKLSRRLFYRKHFLGTALTAPVILMEIVAPRLRGLFVRKDRYPTADAQLALAFLNLYEVTKNRGDAPEVWLKNAQSLAGDLLAQSVPGYHGLGWGYPFDWQNVHGLIPKGTPHITATPYAYEVFTRLFDLTSAEQYLHVARTIAEFVFTDLQDTPTGHDAAASSYTPHDHSKVVNASAYRAFVLFDAAQRFNNDAFRTKAWQNLRFMLQSQREDGAWLYAIDDPAQSFIDHFHTCFVLKNLFKLNRSLQSAEVDQAIKRGYQWYRKELFDTEDNPKAFAVAPRLELVRLEMYGFAEAITLGVLLKKDIPAAYSLAKILAARLIRNHQVSAGHWVTRVYRGGVRHTVPFLRWPQSQLFLAVTNLLVSMEHSA